MLATHANTEFLKVESNHRTEVFIIHKIMKPWIYFYDIKINPWFNLSTLVPC